jgi:hypothetical protein
LRRRDAERILKVERKAEVVFARETRSNSHTFRTDADQLDPEHGRRRLRQSRH